MLPNQDTEYTVLKSLGDAYLQVAQGQRDAVAADDQDRWSEEEVSEAMRPGERQRKMAAKMHDPYVRGGSKTRGQAHNIAVRGDVSTGDPAIKSRGGDPKKAKGMGYGDQGAGNAAARKAGNEPMRGNRDPRPKNESYRGMTVGEILSENSEGV